MQSTHLPFIYKLIFLGQSICTFLASLYPHCPDITVAWRGTLRAANSHRKACRSSHQQQYRTAHCAEIEERYYLKSRLSNVSQARRGLRYHTRSHARRLGLYLEMSHHNNYYALVAGHTLKCVFLRIIREYGSTLYIGIAMVFYCTFGPM